MYQPIINLTDNSVYGYEALSRVCKEACIKVIAEGIETEIEAAIIKELGLILFRGIILQGLRKGFRVGDETDLTFYKLFTPKSYKL